MLSFSASLAGKDALTCMACCSTVSGWVDVLGCALEDLDKSGCTFGWVGNCAVL